jgi:protein-disulfide isomerase
MSSVLSSRLLGVATGIVVVCAVTVTALTVRRELFATPKRGPSAPRSPEKVANWRAIADAGTRIGPAAAPIIVPEFSDFQCPFCRRLAPVLKELKAKYPLEVAVSYRHFPIPRHAHAGVAAQASECAGAQGRFEAYHDALFASADSIGKLSWADFARTAGVPDTKRFERCLADSTYKSRVEQDVKAGMDARVRGTPTVLVNEWRLVGAPSLVTLDSVVQTEMARRKRQ